MKARDLIATAICALLASCASSPPVPSEGKSGVWGYLRLVPHAGVEPAVGGSGAYGDRRMRNVELVDYSHPGFAVVYLDGPTSADDAPLKIRIRDGSTGARIEPSQLALYVGARVKVTNESEAEQLLSSPSAGILERLAPGASASFTFEPAGEHTLFLLGSRSEAATLFAAPGPFTVVNDTGRFELLDQAPGPHALHAWHPRFPPTTRQIHLTSNQAERVDLELGVGQAEKASP